MILQIQVRNKMDARKFKKRSKENKTCEVIQTKLKKEKNFSKKNQKE